jgi:hypothetical protein
MMTTIREKPVGPIYSMTPRNFLKYIVSLYVLFASTLAVHGTNIVDDAHPASRLEAPKDLEVVSLPGVAVADEAMLVQSIYARRGSNPLWSRAGQRSR